MDAGKRTEAAGAGRVGKTRRRRRIDPMKAREAAGGWYERIPVEETWSACSTCGTRARILDKEHEECIRCRVVQVRAARTGAAEGGPA